MPLPGRATFGQIRWPDSLQSNAAVAKRAAFFYVFISE